MTDHPDIVNCELYGYPDGPRKWPICPVCGEECAIFYKSGGEIVACENCIEVVDAWEELEDDE